MANEVKAAMDKAVNGSGQQWLSQADYDLILAAKGATTAATVRLFARSVAGLVESGQGVLARMVADQLITLYN